MFLRVSSLAFRIIAVAFATATFLVLAGRRPVPLNQRVGQTFETLYKIYDSHSAPNFDGLHGLYDSHAPKIPPFHDHYNDVLSPQLFMFWREFEKVLEKLRPHAAPISPKKKVKAQVFDSNKTRTREGFIDIFKEDLEELKKSHREMMQQIPNFDSRLPYDRGSKGVVMTAGVQYIGVLLVSLRMLRRSGSELPVEIFLDSWETYDQRICEEILPSLNAKCYILSEIWATTPSLEKLKSYQYKVFAILFSSFQDVIFLDADAFPVHNPDGLLQSEPFDSTGLVTWPDFWFLSSSVYFYDIANIRVPNLSTRASTESGIIIISKEKHARTLLLAAYYNYYGPKIYYPLLSQGAAGQGDKETFLHAAMAFDSSFYAVRSPVIVMGKWLDGEWHSSGMKQADPVQDFEIYTKTTVTQNNITAKKIRPFFIHNNILKLDAKHVFDDRFHWISREGKFTRLWGDKVDLFKDFGRDIEKDMWEELIACVCVTKNLECEKVHEHYRNVYIDVQS
jgi:alpha 1,2-mannosyltransferase